MNRSRNALTVAWLVALTIFVATQSAEARRGYTTTGTPENAVLGPASSTDNAIARFDGTTGKLVQNSGVTITDDGDLVLAGNSLHLSTVGNGAEWYADDTSGAKLRVSGNNVAQILTSGLNLYQWVGTDPVINFRRSSDGTTHTQIYTYDDDAGSTGTGWIGVAGDSSQGGGIEAGVLWSFNEIWADGFYQGTEIADPAAPAANKGRLYFRDNGAGKTQLVVRFPTGAVQVIATEP